MRTELREIDGQIIEVKIYPPLKKKISVVEKHISRSGRDRAARWIAYNNGQFSCR